MSTPADAQVTVTHDESAARYELHAGDELVGVAEYRRDGTVLTFHHTEVNPRYEGRGLGSVLIEAAMRDIAGRGADRVRPTCWFVAAWLDRHPDVAAAVLVA